MKVSFYLVSLCKIRTMKNIYVGANVIIVLLTSIVLMVQFDPTYQTVKHSADAIENNNEHQAHPSPNHMAFLMQLNNHWKVSTVFSTLEDVFYPFRQWKGNVIKSIKHRDHYSSFRRQYDGVIRQEKATKVRALRAHFLAERRNFKDQLLTNDYLNKFEQWQAIYLTMIDRKVALLNSNYNNQWPALSLILSLFLCLFLIVGRNMSIIAITGILIALVLSSYHPLHQWQIPFHWIVIVWLSLIAGWPKTRSVNKHATAICFALPVLISASSTIGIMVGWIAMQAVWAFPRIKSLFYGLFLIHPFGAWCVLQKKHRINYALLLVGIGILLIANVFSVSLRLTSPIAYLGSIGMVINSVIVMMAIGSLMEDQKSFKSKGNQGLMLMAIGIVIVIKTIFNPHVFDWGFSFLWNPLIQWGSVIAICVSFSKR